ncbi:MAG TPA: hypothetical protein VMW24_17820 [Sedimentisphaerales bacterium]|nr:hypothetical protein [Sedimentisphaerales bacterium]
MKYVIAALILGLSALAGLSCQEARTDKGPDTEAGDISQQRAGADGRQEEPLLLDDEPLLLDEEPLLLDDESEKEGVSGGADNSRCHVCHINYSQEEIAVKHAGAAIGCAHCHGASDAHIADESWASGGNGTAPDTMFPKDKINPFCIGCHTGSMVKGPQHEAIVAGNSEKVCTDCHGKHRLTTRKCKWK